jgi:hypothetical protein
VADIDGLLDLLEKLTKKHEQAIPKIKAEYDAAIVLTSQKMQQDMLVQLQPIFHLFALTRPPRPHLATSIWQNSRFSSLVSVRSKQLNWQRQAQQAH